MIVICFGVICFSGLLGVNELLRFAVLFLVGPLCLPRVVW